MAAAEAGPRSWSLALLAGRAGAGRELLPDPQPQPELSRSRSTGSWKIGPAGAHRLALSGARAWAQSEAANRDYEAPVDTGAEGWITPARPGLGLNTQAILDSGPKRKRNKDSIQYSVGTGQEEE